MRLFTQCIVTLALLGASMSQALACSLFNSSDCAGENQIIYCPEGSNCSIDSGVNTVKNGINDINTDRKFSQYAQDTVIYLLGFLAIVGVIIGIYAGFLIMTSAGDESKIKKGKDLIKYMCIGFIVIFLAYSIVGFIIGAGANKNGKKGGGILGAVIQFTIPSAYAANDALVHFGDYRKALESLIPELDADYKKNNGKLSVIFLLKTQNLVREAMKTFPDDENILANEALGKTLLADIEVAKKQLDNETILGKFAESLKKFIKDTKVPQITAEVLITPSKGNAPLTSTLTVRNAVDPSGVTINARDIVWSIREAGNKKKILGVGPSLTTTFHDEKTYTIFVDITSSSRNSSGKMDTIPFSQKANVQVDPRLADMFVYLNGTNVTRTSQFKVTPLQARAGIIIDATATIPYGTTRFTSTKWDFGNGITSQYDTAPKIERANYFMNGQYPIKLELINNIGEKINYTLNLLVVDPIASIKTDKFIGFANEEFKFAAASAYAGYAIAYEWAIRDQDSDKIVFTANAQNISYKFPRTGKYEVRLKSKQANGKEDTDLALITVEPREPVVDFSLTRPSSETPNRIYLDATKSYDPDTNEGSKLNYTWLLDGQEITLENPSRNGAVGYFTINSLGNHKIGLNITNGTSGKNANKIQEVVIDSLLDVSLQIVPKLVTVGSTAVFIGSSENANTFDWNYGDGSTEILNVPRSSHIYKKSGSYDVTMKVSTSDGKQTNTITRRIHVTDADTPFAIITMKRGNDEILPTPNTCNEQEAFVIDRSSPYTFSADASTNIDGQPVGLSYTWKYLGKTALTKDVSVKFDELGCMPIELTIRSNKNGKTSQTQTFVKLINLPPSLSSITVTADKIETDPVLVKVSAGNAIDPDGAIVSYLWYYWTDSDPEAQDFRVTRAPQTTFVLPKLNGKYYFGVILEDSNGEKYSSQESNSQQFSLTLTSDNINTPILTLKTTSTQVGVGKTTPFEVTAKNIMGNDISDKIQLKWDFDGDGFYDTNSSNRRENYTYTKPGTYQMKVKATYKGVSNTKYQQIIVTNQLEPNYESIVVGNTVYLMNTTSGLYKTAKWDFGDEFSSDSLQGATFVSSGNFPLRGTLTVGDGNAVKTIDIVLQKDVINAKRLERSKNAFEVYTFPSSSQAVIDIQNDTTPFFIVATANKLSGSIAIDTDLSVDSNLNGDPTDDTDNLGTESEKSGAPYMVKFIRETQIKKVLRVRLLDPQKQEIASKDITLNLQFVRNANTIASNNLSSASGSSVTESFTPQDKLLLEKLKDFIRQAPDDERIRLQVYASDLQENWFDARDKLRTLLEIEAFVEASKLDAKLKDQIFTHLQSIFHSDSSNKDELSTAVKIITDLLPKTHANYQEMLDLLKEIKSHPNDLEKNRPMAKKIIDFIKADESLTNNEKLIIKQNLQTIIYGGSTNVPEKEITESSGSNGEQTKAFAINTLYIFIAIIALILGGGLVLYVYFVATNTRESFGFQDFLIEKFFNGAAHATTPPRPPVLKPEPIIQPPLEQIVSHDPLLRAQEAVIVPEIQEAPQERQETPVSPSAAFPSSELPSWLATPNITTLTENSETKIEHVSEEEIVEEIQEISENLPPWLNETEAQAAREELAQETENTISEALPETPSDALPSWLSLDMNDELKLSEDALIEAPPVQEEVAVVEKKPVRKRSPKIQPEALASEIPSSPDDDLPAWLKG